MRVLLAVEFEAGRWRKVLVAKFRKDGTGSLALKWNGTVESRAVRDAARYFAKDSAAVEIMAQIGGKNYRVTRV